MTFLSPRRSWTLRSPPKLALTLTGLALGTAGCARVTSSGVAPVVEVGWVEEGIASWYGEPFHGRTTASGEVYDMEAMTAAHRTLPFGTLLRVSNLDNGRSTTVRVNDRGPFVKGRNLDLSRRAARELEMVRPGTARVRLAILGTPPGARGSCWIVQTAAFEGRENAEMERSNLEQRGYAARITAGPSGLHRVRVGPLDSRSEAERITRETDGMLLSCGIFEG